MSPFSFLNQTSVIMSQSIYDSQLARIATLKAELAKEEDRLRNLPQPPRYPIKTEVYVYGCDETMYEKGQKLGLTQLQLETFFRTAYELALSIEIQEDGSSMLTHVDGVALVEPTAI